jgi:uroporphyrinogen decarboxylase
MTTPKERVDAAFALSTADRVPVWNKAIGLCRRIVGIGYGEFLQNADIAARCYLAWNDLIGDDMLMAYLDVAVEAEGFGQKTLFFDDEASVSDPNDRLIRTPDDYAKLERYDVEAVPRIKETLRLAEILAQERGETHHIIGTPMEPLVTLGNMRGMTELLMDCVRHRDEVDYALDVVTDVEIAYAKALIDHGVTVIQFCPDYNNPSVMGEKMIREIEGKYLSRFLAEVGGRGAKVIIHNCSSSPYVDLAFEFGEFDAFLLSSLPKGCASWQEFKETYGRRVAICGHLDPTPLGTKWTYDETMAVCRTHIEELGAGGGFILTPGCEFPANGSMQNAKAMVDSAKKYGAYSG